MKEGRGGNMGSPGERGGLIDRSVREVGLELE